MENPKSPLITWPYFYQGKSMEELRHSLFYTTLELESTRIAAQEEITRREQELTHLQQLLNKTIKERDEAQDTYKNLLLEKLLTIPHGVNSGNSISTIEDNEPNLTKKDGLSPSDCSESAVSSLPLQPQHVPEDALLALSARRPLPEKGKLLQAMMNAGPLLQTLLLAGPLPQWRHPPPPLETFEIPPVHIHAANSIGDEFMVNGSNCGAIANRKRGYDNVGVYDGVFSESNKYQRVLFH